MRGMMVSVNQLTIMIGVLSAQIANWRISLIDTEMPVDATPEVIATSWNGLEGWRWMFGAEAVPALLFFVLMFLVPESARWLVKSGQLERAHQVFTRLGGRAYAEAEVADVRSTISDEEVGTVRFSDLVEPHVFKVLLLGVFLSFLQQWSGMNAVFYYAADIFKAAGYNIKAMMLNIVVIGGVMVLSVFVTMALVDRVGRKTLVLFGCGTLALVYILIGGLLPPGDPGPPGGAVDPRVRERLLLHPGPAPVGHPLGDLPEPHPWRRDLDRCHRPLGRQLHPHLHVPHGEPGPGHGRRLLAVRGGLHRGLRRGPACPARDPGQDPRGHRARPVRIRRRGRLPTAGRRGLRTGRRLTGFLI